MPASLQSSQASAHRRLPAFIHLKNKIEGNRDKCTLCTEEITTNAALKRAKERNKLFHIYWEERGLKMFCVGTEGQHFC